MTRYLTNVRHQYENLPYPHRNPAEEKTRLIRPTSERLCNLNHHCYRGRRNFDDFSALIAGGGTGDGTIYLAAQLTRHPQAKVVHLDISTASIEVAKKRAKVRGLTNIEWVHGSILDVAEVCPGPFDYINCTGVLHHLADPDAGLSALKAVLAPGGAMGLMVYARYGRTGVYQMQELMRLVNDGEEDIGTRVGNARTVLANLPPSNWMKRSEDIITDHVRFGDAGVFDLFLHEQDRAYTVQETYEFVERAGLHLLDYAWARERMALEPSTWLKNPLLLERISTLPVMERRAIAELTSGTLTRQHVYAAPEADRKAQPGVEMVPFLVDFPDPRTHVLLSAHMRRQPGVPVEGGTASGKFSFTPRRYTADIFQYLDGNTPLGGIFEKIRGGKSGPSDDELLADFAPVYEAFAMADAMLLRHQDTPPTVEVMHGDALPKGGSKAGKPQKAAKGKKKKKR
ncbi:MAG: class I SAM-dependent methyltransferase [Nitrospirota bacterium]|nr:class I SAM-dependent methyltransferase [Nitrospirota bacterium]